MGTMKGRAYFALSMACAVLLSGCATPVAPSAQPQSTAQIAGEVDSATCAILDAGNQHYVKEDFAAAVSAYKTVETIDRHGRSSCTASIYASIATCYSILAERTLAVSASEAVAFYRTASRYNRAFAYAVECQLKDCKNSIDFWTQGY